MTIEPRNTDELTDRWVAIVAAIRRHADAFNVEAGRAILNVEQSAESTVTVAEGPEGSAHLTATLEGTFVSMNARDALFRGEFRRVSVRQRALLACKSYLHRLSRAVWIGINQ